MSLRLSVVPTYVEAVNASGLKERNSMDYDNVMKAKLHNIDKTGTVVYFRTYINPIEYWEYAFSRKNDNGKVDFLYTTYGEDYGDEE